MPQGSPSYHKHTVLRTALCLQNKQGDLQQITGGLDSGQQKLGQTGKKKNMYPSLSPNSLQIKGYFY